MSSSVVNDHMVCKAVYKHSYRVEHLKRLIAEKKDLLPMSLEISEINQAMSDPTKSAALLSCLDLSCSIIKDSMYYDQPDAYYNLTKDDTNLYSSILCFKIMKILQ